MMAGMYAHQFYLLPLRLISIIYNIIISRKLRKTWKRTRTHCRCDAWYDNTYQHRYWLFLRVGHLPFALLRYGVRVLLCRTPGTDLSEVKNLLMYLRLQKSWEKSENHRNRLSSMRAFRWTQHFVKIPTFEIFSCLKSGFWTLKGPDDPWWTLDYYI